GYYSSHSTRHQLWGIFPSTNTNDGAQGTIPPTNTKDGALFLHLTPMMGHYSFI
ncbi:unnamed protein product, partial [Staurois parvus]